MSESMPADRGAELGAEHRRLSEKLERLNEAIAALDCFPTVNCAKAVTELGHAPRPTTRTLADLHRYFTRMEGGSYIRNQLLN